MWPLSVSVPSSLQLRGVLQRARLLLLLLLLGGRDLLGLQPDVPGSGVDVAKEAHLHDGGVEAPPVGPREDVVPGGVDEVGLSGGTPGMGPESVAMGDVELD